MTTKRAAAKKAVAAAAPEIPERPMRTGSAMHPAVGLGLWALGRWSREAEAATAATVERALALGVRWFDTAEVYGSGRSERLLGDVLGRVAPSGRPPFVVTKVSSEHLRSEQVRAALLGSLQRLGRPSVDLFLVHFPDPRVPLPETMAALERLWREGRIGGIGVSNFSTAELEAAQAALAEAKILVNQVQYNLFDRAEADEVREYCRSNGILVEAYTPLARGLLAGRYLSGEKPPPEVRRFRQHLFEGDRFAEFQARGRALKSLADEAHVPMASLAIHWLLRQGALPVLGASRPPQVDELLDAFVHVPPDRVLDRADAIARGDRA